MLAFRWTPEEDIAFCARRQMHGWLGAVSEDELSAGMARFTERQQKLRTIVGASNPAVMPMFLDQYAALLDVLEAGLSKQLFLFGERPSIADFGLYGMLSQFVIDPTPSGSCASGPCGCSNGRTTSTISRATTVRGRAPRPTRLCTPW